MSRRLPPLKNLEAFAAAARLGSFTKAAEELALTQSAISQQLVKLEQDLGQKLFVRRGKGVTLTAAGELLYQSVRRTLEQLRAGIARIEPYRNPDSILLACADEAAQGWLLPRLADWQRRFGATELWLITRQEIAEIDRIDVDLAITRRPLHQRDIEVAPLLEDERVAVAGPGLARAVRHWPWPALLRQAPVLLFEAEPEWNGLLGSVDPATLRRAATFDDARLALLAAATDCGIAYLPRTLAAGEIAAGRLEFLGQIPRQPLNRLWLMRSRLAPRTPRVDDAYQWLLAQAAAG